jgi:hypothetical protein
MKRNSIYLILCLLITNPVFSQDIISNLSLGTSEAIHQISTGGIDNILSFQTLNRGISNYALTQQIGDQNKASINQRHDPTSNLSNQTYAYQQGNFNELSVGQIGTSNLLLSFQLGYLSSRLTLNPDNSLGFGAGSGQGDAFTIGIQSVGDGALAEGNHNSIQVSQSGNNNAVMAVQRGDDNFISAGQSGNNNYLFVLQQGKNNALTGYEQENSSTTDLFDTVIQTGDNLTLNATDVSKSKANGNVFSQTGTNLSLQVNNGFVNSFGGIGITQTGRDMKVVVDQSYFSLPLK